MPITKRVKTPHIEICAAHQVRRKIFWSKWLPWKRAVGTVISIENPGFEEATETIAMRTLEQRGFAPRLKQDYPQIKQFIMNFWDSNHVSVGEDPWHSGPSSVDHARLAVSAAKTHQEDSPRKKILIHCSQGVARSPAVALTIMAAFAQEKDKACKPDKLIRKLLRHRRKAAPDLEFMRRADEYLKLDSELTLAVQNHPRLSANRVLHRERLFAYGTQARP